MKIVENYQHPFSWTLLEEEVLLICMSFSKQGPQTGQTLLQPFFKHWFLTNPFKPVCTGLCKNKNSSQHLTNFRPSFNFFFHFNWWGFSSTFLSSSFNIFKEVAVFSNQVCTGMCDCVSQLGLFDLLLLFSLFCIKKHFVGLQTRNRQINMICYKEKLFSSKFFAKEKSNRNLSVTLLTVLLKNFTFLSDVSWFSKASCKVLLLRSDYFLAQSLAAASTTDFFYLMVFRLVNLNPGANPNSYDITNG